MKRKTFSLVCIVAVVTLFSCKKDSVSSYQVAGLYTGTYTVDNISTQPPLFYSIVAYPDGSVITKGKGGDNSDLFAAGTYTLAGTTFTATINSFIKSGSGVPVTQTISATFNASNGTLTNGTWQDTVNPFGTKNAGKFSTLQRVN